MKVEHIRATTKEERNRMCGSKYVQSDLKNCYHSVAKDLLDGRYVLFSGTPCQVEGLYVALKNISTDRLVTCDLICYAVSSPKVFSSHVEMLGKKYRSSINHYECRPAQNGHAWGCSTDLAINEKGKKLYYNAWVGLKRRLYYSNVDKRPSCHNCKYCNFTRMGDFTIGDCRNASIVVPDYDFYYGASTLLVNTPKAKEILPQLQKDITVWQTTPAEIIQSPLREVSKASPNRELFWKVYGRKGYVPAVKACFGKAVIIKDWARLKVLKK
jgi:coenzyme F420-reducing hydrogenase beta subunit